MAQDARKGKSKQQNRDKPEAASGAGLAKIPPGRTPVLYCRTGVRSAQALAALHAAGFADACHLRGGIVAWTAEIEPDVPLC